MNTNERSNKILSAEARRKYNKLLRERKAYERKCRFFRILCLITLFLFVVTIVVVTISDLRATAEIINEEPKPSFVTVVKVSDQYTDTGFQMPEETKVVIEDQQYADIPLDSDLKEYIVTKSKAAEIPPELMFALADRESKFNINAKSPTNDFGLFQINQINFGWLGSELGVDVESNILDPYINTDCAIHILTEYREKYQNSDWNQLLMRYNMGPAGAQKCFDSGIHSSEYSTTILRTVVENFGVSNLSL